MTVGKEGKFNIFTLSEDLSLQRQRNKQQGQEGRHFKTKFGFLPLSLASKNLVLSLSSEENPEILHVPRESLTLAT